MNIFIIHFVKNFTFFLEILFLEVYDRNHKMGNFIERGVSRTGFPGRTSLSEIIRKIT